MKNTSDSPPSVAEKRRVCLLTRRGYAALVLRLGVFALAVWLLFSQVFLLTRCDGMGMFPAVKDGDLVLAYRLCREYSKGDVVAYTREGEMLLGRVVARQTDVVLLDGSGSLQVNGSTQAGEILYPTYPRENTVYPLQVQEGMVFLLGDYRTQTRDSRDFGPIPLDNILGKVITVVRRRGV